MKTILLTGAAGSIGEKIIRSFCKSYKIICVDKNKKSLKLLKKKFSKIEIYECDLIHEPAVKKLIEFIERKFKTIDILINNAGQIYSHPIIKLGKKGFVSHSYKDWKKTIDLNLNSLFLLSSKVIENFCNNRKKGLIINISSISAKGNIGQSAYSSAKSAVEVLTKIWSEELSSFNIRVTCIAPGFFKTKSTFDSLNSYQIEHVKKNTPSLRLGKTYEIISALKFIINNKFFNGKVLPLDGGLKL